MPVTILGPFNDTATQVPITRSGQGVDPLGPRGIRLLAYVIGVLLVAPWTASALELGEASIKSGLGESLRVEIPYRLAGTERLLSACIGLASSERDALPTYAGVSRISITPNHIEIFDERRVLEPLIGLNVDVHCAGVPHFVRSYQLFVDPPTEMPTLLSNGPAVATARTQSAIDAAAPIAAPPLAATRVVPNETTNSTASAEPTASVSIAVTARANASPRARGLSGGNLPQGQTYRVVRGDTLSGIAARVTGRPVTIREAVDAIFAANPAAFTRGNPDLIEEGRSITIPNLMPSEATLASAPAPASRAVHEAEVPTVAPVAVEDPAPAPLIAAAPLHTDEAASVAGPEASQPIPSAVSVVATPSVAPVAAPTRGDVALEAPTPAPTGRISGWLIALLAVAAVILLSASVAFMRRRREREAAALVGSEVREPVRRQPVELVSRMHVVEGSLTGTHAAKQLAAMRGAEIAPVADSGAGSPAEPKDVALRVGPTDSVDFDIGAPVVTNERVAESDRAYIIDARDDSMEESAPTALMPDIAAEHTVRQPPRSSKPDHSQETEEIKDDENHTLTIVELDMLRQDYESEHTLTQQASPELRDAVADLRATQAAHAATEGTATLESPQVSQDETTAESPTARVRRR